MTSPYYVLVVVIVLLAALFAEHLKLKHKYMILDERCEETCQGYQELAAARREKEISQRDAHHNVKSKSSFLMQSSSKEKAEDRDSLVEIESKGYVEENNPTVHEKWDKEDVSVTSSATCTKQVVLQTSCEEDQQMGQKSVQENRSYPTYEGMASTTSDSGGSVIEPSESLHFTQRNLEEETTSKSIDEEKLTQTSIRETNINSVVERSAETPKKASDYEIYKKIKYNQQTLQPQPSLELKSGAELEDSEGLLLSQFTEEKEVYVRETGSRDFGVDDAIEDYPRDYFETQDSTPVLNTNYLDESLGLHTTDINDFVEGSGKADCTSLGCDVKEKEEDLSGLESRNENGDVRNKSKEELVSKAEREDLERFVKQGTSVWCDRGSKTICRFKNLCYHTGERDFVFFKGGDSVLGFGHSRSMDDVFDINLSTIHGHNTQMFSVVTLSADDVDKFSVGLVQKKAVAMNRFKPDNIMHVLHDDILPLHTALNHFKDRPQGKNTFDRAIIFTDIYEDGSYFDLYSSLSSFRPISPWKFNQTYDLLCFSEIQVGLPTSTIWYQYGFFQPQGPVAALEDDIVKNIREATDYLPLHFRMDCPLCGKGDYLVFLSRKDNRLILNEVELIMAIIRSTRLKVMSVSLETHSLSDIITTVRNSRGVFGMHGSLLSLAMFLPPGSVLIELFPFAVNPSKYTPFKTFCDLPGLGLVYKSWANPWGAKSVAHPDRPASEGGIRHLPDQLQRDIASQEEVPEHLCCDDPSWLYHIYQDTIVDIDIVVKLFTKAIQEADTIKELTQNKTSNNAISIDIPGSVKDLQCKKAGDAHTESKPGDSFVISWKAPWSSQYKTAANDFQYEVVIQKGNGEESSGLFLPSSQLTHRVNTFDCSVERTCNVWVRVVNISGHKSHSKFVRCFS